MEQRLYDLIFIARPATPEEDLKKVLTVIETACNEKGGKIEKTEHWGTRKLAYRVAKHREGIYVYQQIHTEHAELIAEIERRHRSPVQMMHLRNGIFDDASISVITTDTVGEIGRAAGVGYGENRGS